MSNRVFLHSIIDNFINEVYVEKPVKTGLETTPDAYKAKHERKLLRKEGFKPGPGEREVYRVATTAGEEGFDPSNPDHVKLASVASEDPNSDEALVKDNIGSWYGSLGLVLKHAKEAREVGKQPFLKIAHVSRKRLSKEFEGHEVMDRLDREGNFGQAYYLFGRGCRNCDPQRRKLRFLIPPEARVKSLILDL